MTRRHEIRGVRIADNFVDRLVGLMGRAELSNVFVWFPRCGSVHTCFMRGEIDVLFLDDQGRVVDRHPKLPPWRFRIGARGSCSVMELPAGYLGKRDIQIGDRVTWA